MSASIRISRELQSIASDLKNAIEAVAGEPVAFTLMVFTDGRASYISTASREDSVREIKRLLAYWGEEMPDIPAHDYKS